MRTELLALLVEVVSVTAAGVQMKKPITGLAKTFGIKAFETPTGPAATPEQTDAAFKKGISVLASTSKSVIR